MWVIRKKAESVVDSQRRNKRPVGEVTYRRAAASCLNSASCLQMAITSWSIRRKRLAGYGRGCVPNAQHATWLSVLLAGGTVP